MLSVKISISTDYLMKLARMLLYLPTVGRGRMCLRGGKEVVGKQGCVNWQRKPYPQTSNPLSQTLLDFLETV